MAEKRAREEDDGAPVASLAGFKITRVLADDSLSKRISVLGKFEGRQGEAIVTVARRHFARETLGRLLSAETATSLHFHNDIYVKYDADVPGDLAQVTVDLVYPATAKHIAKATEQKSVMVQETAACYAAVTQPFLESLPAAAIQWVYNILEKKKEVERLIFEDPAPDTGFMLHPDLKWDQQDLEGLYCLAICHRRDVHSLRDLRAEHLSLLTNIRDKGMAAIQDKYGVESKYLRVFVHYQPSYYHFHVHFVHTSYNGGLGLAAGKAHLLDDIIDNLTCMGSDYYAKRTLHYALGEEHPLLACLQKAGYL